MNSKLKYPMEAFAFAMVLFSAGMKSAMVVGIALIFGDVLLAVLGEWLEGQNRYLPEAIGGIIAAAVVYLLMRLVGVTPVWQEIAGMVVLGVLLAKHQDDRSRQGQTADYDEILLHDSIVYGVFVVAAIAREFLAKASIYEYSMTKNVLVSGSFGKPMFALIFAGVFVAIANRILRAEAQANAALWVCLPVILIETPFVWNNVPEIAGIAVGILVTAVLYLTFRTKFLLTDPQKHIAGIPAEMTALGMIYMIVSLL